MQQVPIALGTKKTILRSQNNILVTTVTNIKEQTFQLTSRIPAKWF